MGNLKNKLKTSPLTKGVYHCLSTAYFRVLENRVQKRKRRDLQKDGMAIIRQVQSILEQTNHVFFFDMGTLLGIIREGRLLKHDMDIDLAVIIGSEEEKLELVRLLAENGIREKFRYVVDELGIVEQSFLCGSVKFDINYYNRDGENDVCYLLYRDPEKAYPPEQLDVVKLLCPHITGTEKADFQGLQVPVPASPEAYLAVRYGENWRIPDKKYVYWKGPSTHPTEYTGRQVQPQAE